MAYNPLIHNRQSTRRKGYDYSQPGFYFATLCVQYRRRLFGEICNRKMLLNPAGRMVDSWWRELETKFPNIALHEFVVMPDHFHGLIEIVSCCPCGDESRAIIGAVNVGTVDVGTVDVGTVDVGANLRVRPNDASTRGTHASIRGTHASTRGTHASTRGTHASTRGTHASTRGTHVGVPLGTMVQWFKTMTTNAYIRGVRDEGWPRFEKRMWQRNYFDRIIEDEKYLRRVRNYILQNPAKWNGS